jgi:hypothetical protein
MSQINLKKATFLQFYNMALNEIGINGDPTPFQRRHAFLIALTLSKKQFEVLAAPVKGVAK